MGKNTRRPGIDYEREYWQAGRRYVAGLDEAGRGAWAGPVVAGAVILPACNDVPATLRDVADSKLLSARKRDELFDIITQYALSFGVGFVLAEEIDRVGIVPATQRAMRAAIESLHFVPQALLIDALHLPRVECPQMAIIRGDQLSLSIAAASIVAKVTRDRWMQARDADYAGYGFGQHKGYGTPQHRAALSVLGPCPIHRRSFAPVAQRCLEWEGENE